MVGLTVRSMVTVATRRPRRQPAMSEAYSSAPAYTEPATPEAATRNPDDEYTQPDGSRMCDAHCTVVKMVGVQEPSPAPSVSLLRAPVQVVLSGRVASSSGGQQAQCAQVRLSRPHGRLTSRPPLRHRHHRPHCQRVNPNPPRRRPRRRGARQTTYDDLVGDDDDSDNSY